jgi:hypothetical protein
VQGTKLFSTPKLSTGSGTHRASYLLDAGGTSPGVKRPRREADHSGTEVKMRGDITSLPHSLYDSFCCLSYDRSIAYVLLYCVY